MSKKQQSNIKVTETVTTKTVKGFGKHVPQFFIVKTSVSLKNG